VPVEPDDAPRTIEVLPDQAAEVATEPAAAVHHGTRWNAAFGAVLLIGVSFLLVGTALTVARFSGYDHGAARRVGIATIERCSLRGPISLNGFGYYDRCTVSVVWNNGSPSRVTIDKPGFFAEDNGERVGDTVDIGENRGGYSRPEFPERPWITLLARLIALLGLLPAVAAAVYLRQAWRTAAR
jgi:hypothetical protein